MCLKTTRLRGQAWVVFADVPSATSALRSLQGFTFYDRPLARRGLTFCVHNVTKSFCSDLLLRTASPTPSPNWTARGFRPTSASRGQDLVRLVELVLIFAGRSYTNIRTSARCGSGGWRKGGERTTTRACRKVRSQPLHLCSFFEALTSFR